MLLSKAYSHFVEASNEWHQQQNIKMCCWAQQDDSSPCIVRRIDEQQVEWQPVLQQPAADFSNVELALECELHPDIKQFYSQYYGANLAADHQRGKLALLMVWSAADLPRLQENIIGHLIMKRRLKQRETVFFAVTEDDNIMLSVLNATGEVYLESVGKDVQQKVADNLADFLNQLRPAPYSPDFD
ncbi:SecY-interacting protein [Arsukibacterium sp.]|uniref:SecY-interacting protein n=1 Tax=Arsukibacterium sp. TaxID=1977258 RepID=UPI002FDA5680